MTPLELSQRLHACFEQTAHSDFDQPLVCDELPDAFYGMSPDGAAQAVVQAINAHGAAALTLDQRRDLLRSVAQYGNDDQRVVIANRLGQTDQSQQDDFLRSLSELPIETRQRIEARLGRPLLTYLRPMTPWIKRVKKEPTPFGPRNPSTGKTIVPDQARDEMAKFTQRSSMNVLQVETTSKAALRSKLLTAQPWWSAHGASWAAEIAPVATAGRHTRSDTWFFPSDCGIKGLHLDGEAGVSLASAAWRPGFDVPAPFGSFWKVHVPLGTIRATLSAVSAQGDAWAVFSLNPRGSRPNAASVPELDSGAFIGAEASAGRLSLDYESPDLTEAFGMFTFQWRTTADFYASGIGGALGGGVTFRWGDPKPLHFYFQDGIIPPFLPGFRHMNAIDVGITDKGRAFYRNLLDGWPGRVAQWRQEVRDEYQREVAAAVPGNPSAWQNVEFGLHALWRVMSPKLQLATMAAVASAPPKE